MKYIIGIILLLAIIIGCNSAEVYVICPDGTTSVVDLTDCPSDTQNCPSCDDNNSCTTNRCSSDTNYECVYDPIIPCDGNDICENGEFNWSIDCPNTCNDNDLCTIDTFSYEEEQCIYEDILPCLGNGICETGETVINSPLDCEQEIDITVTKIEKTQRVNNAYADLTGTDHTFLIVRFKIENLLIDEENELNYAISNGFYYDPYKMRVQDDLNNYYDVEYDSDLLTDYLDITIIEKGNTRGAALMFVVPKFSESMRFIIYDKFGRQLHTVELY